MSRYLNLSYIITENLSAYGNGKRLIKKKVSSIEKGDTSNNSVIELSSHLGTHIDFPFHFCAKGSKLNNFNVDELIYNTISVIEFDMINKENLLLGEQIYPMIDEISSETEFLIIKTNYCAIRNSEKYWASNPGFQPFLANHLKEKLPLLKAIGFDSISLSSYTNRELGREAHREFLCKNNILIIEDMNLMRIDLKSKINKLFIAPLLIDGADGAPVNIIAEMIVD